jgi:hypothetical protein
MFKKVVRKAARVKNEEIHVKLRVSRSLRSHASGELLCRRGFVSYVETLSDVRTQLAAFLNILP